jgi:guanosine-3',5'-bis(diphosphate) 3'-pyrophosphohydrolase
MQNPPNLTPGETAVILAALQFTVEKRLRTMQGEAEPKGSVSSRIVVTEILSRIGGVSDVTTLTAAILHHVFDCSTSVKKELDVHFGPEVRLLVQELAGNTHLSETERMQDILDRAPLFSVRAKEIAIAEKISKLQALAKSPTETRSLGELRGYLTWMAQIVEACRGVNPALEEYFDALYEEQRRLIPDAEQEVRGNARS